LKRVRIPPDRTPRAYDLVGLRAAGTTVGSKKNPPPTPGPPAGRDLDVLLACAPGDEARDAVTPARRLISAISTPARLQTVLSAHRRGQVRHQRS